MGRAQLHAVLDDLLQLILLGVARQQGDFHAGFGGAGIARLYAELHAVVAEAGDGRGVLHGIAVAQNDGLAQACPHHPGKVVGVGPAQHGGAVRNFSGKITVRHSDSP